MSELLRSSKGFEESHLIQVCPLCDKADVHRRHMHGVGRYYCHSCKWSGDIPKLRERKKSRNDYTRDII